MRPISVPEYELNGLRGLKHYITELLTDANNGLHRYCSCNFCKAYRLAEDTGEQVTVLIIKVA